MDAAFSKDLEAAMATRPAIEQAKGVLFGLRGGTPDQAFSELRHASQTHNVKLQVLAVALVEAAGGKPVLDARVEAALMSEWGSLLPRYSVVRDVGAQESA